MKRIALALVLTLCAGSRLFSVTIRLEATSRQIVINEPFYLQVKIDDPAGADCEVDFPNTPGFEVKEGGRSQSYSVKIINSVVERSVTWIRNWILIPRQAGNFVLGPVSCKLKGQVYTSNQLSIEVLTQRTRSPLSHNLFDVFEPRPRAQTRVFLKAFFDRDEVWCGEQVGLFLDIYLTQPNLQRVGFSPIQRSGFWEFKQETHSSPKPEKVQHEDKVLYRYRYKITTLFPLTPGKKEIAPFSVKIEYGGFWSEAKILKTENLALKVKNLPDGPVGKSSGAVGDYRFTGEIDAGKQGFKKNKPFVLKLRLNGDGNIHAVGNPVFQECTNFHIMQPQITAELSLNQDQVGGTRSWSYLVYPLSGGQLDFPDITLASFSPKTGRWTNQVFSPGSLRVEVDLSASKEIKKTLIPPASADLPLPSRDSYPRGFDLPLALLVLTPSAIWFFTACLIRFFQSHKRRNLKRFKKSHAVGRAIQRVKALKKPSESTGSLEAVLNDFALDLTGLSAGETLGALEKCLNDSKLEPEFGTTWRTLIEQAARLKYSGDASDHQIVQARILDWLTAIKGESWIN